MGWFKRYIIPGSYVSFMLTPWSESRHDANFVITGSTGGCHSDNLQ